MSRTVDEYCLLANSVAHQKGFWTGVNSLNPSIQIRRIQAIINSLGRAKIKAEEENAYELLSNLTEACIRIFDLCSELGLELDKSLEKRLSREPIK